MSRDIGPCDIEILALLIEQFNHRPHILTGCRTLLWINDLKRGEACYLVHLTLHTNAVNELNELNFTSHLGNYRMSVGVPVGNHLSTADGIPISNRNAGTVRHLIALTLTAIFIHQCQLTGARDRHQVSTLMQNRFDVMEFYRTRGLDLNTVNSGRTGGGTTDMEGTHGQLGTRLTNRLSSDNTYRFTHVHFVTTSKVSPITVGAGANACFTKNRRSHLYMINAQHL